MTYVSILYEADRLCNEVKNGYCGKGCPVSILYEADRLCNASYSLPSFSRIRFQSSTRQTDFATGGWPPYRPLLPQVSILYEADRLCNQSTISLIERGIQVSILYEADRLCNGAGKGRCAGPGGFNPLRGRQTLQPKASPHALASASEFQSSTRQTDFATHSPQQGGHHR